MPISSVGGSAILVEAAVHDVFVDGTSVVNNKVAQISLAGKQDVLTAGDNITISGNTISAKDTVYDDTALENRVATIESKETIWGNKQDAISDLSTIRSGAALGATAVQPAQLAGYATEAWVNSEGFLKEHQSLAAYRTAAEQDAIHDATKQDVIADLAIIRSGAALGKTSIQPSDLTPYAQRTDVTSQINNLKDYVDSEGNKKQDKLTPGTNITITSEGVISAQGQVLTAGNGLQINDKIISAKLGEGLKFDSEGHISFDTVEIIGGKGIQFHNNTIDAKIDDDSIQIDSEGNMCSPKEIVWFDYDSFDAAKYVEIKAAFDRGAFVGIHCNGQDAFCLGVFNYGTEFMCFDAADFYLSSIPGYTGTNPFFNGQNICVFADGSKRATPVTGLWMPNVTQEMSESGKTYSIKYNLSNGIYWAED